MPDVLDPELQFFEMADDLIRLSGSDRATMRAVGRALRSTDQFEEVVDGMDTVTLQFDPLQLSLADVQALIGQATQSASDHEEASAELIELEAVFSEDAAPDLDLVANTLDLSKDQIIEDLCAAELRVEMLGFTPGFAYMSGVPEHLHVPRLDTPRQSVKAGSLGLAAGMCGTYALAGPGGWPIIGKIQTPLFDTSWETPFALKPGSRVKLKAVAQS